MTAPRPILHHAAFYGRTVEAVARVIHGALIAARMTAELEYCMDLFDRIMPKDNVIDLNAVLKKSDQGNPQ